jgi:RHS repeat-associated protein
MNIPLHINRFTMGTIFKKNNFAWTFLFFLFLNFGLGINELFAQYNYNTTVGAVQQVCGNQSVYTLLLADHNDCGGVLRSGTAPNTTVGTDGKLIDDYQSNFLIISTTLGIGTYIEFSVSDPNAVSSYVISPDVNCKQQCNLSINWNPAFSGGVTLRMQRFFYNVQLQNTRGGPNGNITNLATYCVNICGNASILLDDYSPIIGSGHRLLSVTPRVGSVQWYEKTPQDNGQFNKLNGEVGYDHDAPLSIPGTYEFYVLYTDNTNTCGNRTSVTQQIIVKPTCVSSSVDGTNNTTSIIASNPEGANAAITGAGVKTVVDNGYSNIVWNTNKGIFESKGGYEVTQYSAFHLDLKGVRDFSQHYDVEFNSTSDITPTTFTNDNDYTVTSSIGSYRFSFTKKLDNVDRTECPNIPELKIFVGGSDMTLAPSKCQIILPDYFCQGTPPHVAGANCTTDIILTHFQWTVISQKGIIANPGIVLTEGADLKIEEVEDPITNTPDNHNNWTELTAYDDYGNTIANSRSYFDGMARPMQSQVKNLSSGVLLASQPVYDQYGRASLTTLPAPVSGLLPPTDDNGCTLSEADRIQFEYKTDFIQTLNGSNYNYKNFDGTYSAAKEYSPDVLKIATAGTLGWYYSKNNVASSTSSLKEPLVVETDYPFVKTEFYNDGTQEVKHVVPPGNAYRNTLGTDYQNVATSKVEAITDTDPDVLNWLKMRKEIYSVNPASLIENAVKNKFTDQQGVKTYTISDKSGKEIISVHLNEDPITHLITQTSAYNFYDDAGRLKHSITPNGVDAYFASTPTAFASIDKTSYEYNHRGWLLAMNEPDAGRTEYKYRKDGAIRFSQNALQRAATPERFSYTNYDVVSRPVESGEYTVATGSTTWATITSDILESRAADGGLSGGTKTDVMITYYDGENGTNTVPYTQDFVMGKVSCTEKTGDTKTWYSYDERGRLVWLAQSIPVIGTKKIEYAYTPTGGIKEIAYQRGVTNEEFYHVYEYNEDTRLQKVYTSTVSPLYVNGSITNGTEQAEYIYYLHGPLKRVNVAHDLQGMDYLYTVEGWLKSINSYDKTKDPGSDATDVFGMTLEYYSGDYTKTGVNVNSLTTTGYPDIFTGTVKASAWFSEKPAGVINVTNAPVAYAYTYDQKYQYTASAWGNISAGAFSALVNTNNEAGIDYDKNGNINHLNRYDDSGPLDNFTYFYDPNKNTLTHVYDNIKAANYAAYEYNVKGEVTQIQNSTGTRYCNYNVRGLMKDVNDGTNEFVEYAYNDKGLRYKKISYDKITHASTETYYVHDAAGNVMAIYDNSLGTMQKTETPIYGSERIGVLYGLNSMYYELNDHLGNVRSVIRKFAGNLEVMSYSDYYPYGMALRSATGSDVYRYGYQGQFAEHDLETDIDNDGKGWNAFELRMYDSRIGRWMGVDPQRQHSSPYVAMGNNPVSGTDPTGGIDDFVFDENGQYKRTDIKDAPHKIVVENSITGKTDSYNFNDPSKDVADLKYLINNYIGHQILFIKNKSEIDSYYKSSGIYSDEAQNSPYSFAYSNSKGGGVMDYWHSFLRDEMIVKGGISGVDIDNDRGGFFVFPNSSLAYNGYDAGNFLWGGAMKYLGISLTNSRQGAHIHNLVIQRTRANRTWGGFFDSTADQQAITNGYSTNIHNGFGSGW